MLLNCLLFTFALPGAGSCEILWDFWPNTTVLGYLNCLEAANLGDCLTADAGDNGNGAVNQTIMLDGSGTSVPSSPGEIQYSWTQVDTGVPMVTLQNADTAAPSFIATALGLYRFQLDATWLCFQDSATVDIQVLVAAPEEMDAILIASLNNTGPVQVTYSHPGDDRLFIVGKNGQIRIYKNGGLLATPFLDITALTSNGSEQGLLGLAFDPDYVNNGIFYVNYTGFTPAGGGISRDTRIVAYERDALDPDLADPSSASLLLSISQPETNHNGGQIHFGPDGHLYISTGDGGGAGDNHGVIGNGQDPTTMLGKILRIQTNGLAPYTVPADNPFVGVAGVLDEIWDLGLRNPWRFSFDRDTGDIYIGDVGQGSWEEVDFEPAGSGGGFNYGWRLREGAHCFNPPTNCDPGGLTDPVFEYSHAGGNCSITGGHVYRGQDIAGIDGFYFFADYCSGDFWSLINTTQGWQSDPLTVFVGATPLSANILGFGEDSQGEIYICTGGQTFGSIYKLTGLHNP